MRWDAFFEEVRSGSIRQAYLFGGTEEYIKREALAKLREALLPAGLEALNEMSLEGTAADKIIEAAETLPVMCDRRLVVVRDWAPLLSGKSRDEDNETRKMIEWLEKPCESCVVVFYMRGEPDGRKKLTEAFKKRSAIVTFDQLTEAEMRRWIASKLKPHGKSMPPDTMRQLLLRAGWELTRLEGELQKLVAYAGDRSEIQEADIGAIVSPSLEFGAFDMINRLFDGDAAGAFETLAVMLERGTNRIAVLASITRQMRGMAFLKIALDGGESVEATGRMLALNPYAAKIMAQKARRYTADTLEKLYEACVDADYAIKSGQARDQAALDALFIEISTTSADSMQQIGSKARQTFVK